MSRSIEFDIVANDKATGKLSGLKKELSDFGNKIAGMFSATALLDRGLSMASDAFSTFMQTLKDVGNLNDAAKAAGLTTTEYQKLSAAAQEAGLSQEAFMKGLKTVKEFIRDAQAEGSKQSKVLKLMGYNQEQVTSGNVDAMEVMLKLSSAVEGADTAQQKYNVAASVLGAKAQELVPLLDGMRTAMSRVSDQEIIPQSTIDKLDDFDKKLERARRQGRATQAEIGNRLLTPEGGQLAGSILGAFVPGGGGLNMGGVLGRMAGTAISTPTPGAPPPTAADKDMAKGLAALGATGAEKSALGAGGANVSTAQGLGMATSMALAQAQTNYLATIANNTAPSLGSGAIPGRSDFTKADASYEEFSASAQRARFTPRRGPAR
jgi:hypothetical protein